MTEIILLTLAIVVWLARGYHIDHLCKTRNCINPVHLEAVTPLENARRSRGVFNSDPNDCINGHKLKGYNLIRRKEPNGLVRRLCRDCINATKRKNYKKKQSITDGENDE